MRNAKGTTLVEVTVAILLTAVITTSVFSVALTAKRLGTKSERRVAAAFSARLLLDRLKNFVTADFTSAQALAMGPNGGAWNLPGLTGYALNEGTFDASVMLPQKLRDPPFNMTMNYTVSDSAANPGQAAFRPLVTVDVNWTEPP